MRYSSAKVARARKYPYFPTIVHIFTGPMLVLRYHARYAATCEWPRPESADVVLLASFCVTSFLLEAARSALEYVSPVWRTGFHAAIFIQPAIFSVSWIRGGDPALFRASIKMLNWFASFRLLMPLLTRIDPNLKKNFVLQSSTNVLLSGVFAMWEAGVPAGVPAFLGLVAVLIIVERAIAEAIYNVPDSSLLKKLILASGYVDYNFLRHKAKEAEETKVDSDGMNVDL
ncbi:unnamed protein product [Discula destructiva]